MSFEGRSNTDHSLVFDLDALIAACAEVGVDATGVAVETLRRALALTLLRLDTLLSSPSPSTQITRTNDGVPASNQRRVRDALAYIAMHACEPRLDLAAVAAAVGCSRCHLSRELNALTGRPFSHHVREVRLRQAVMLIRNRQRSIKEIAAEVGYSSCTVFGRQFRAVLGLSPVSWRQISATHDDL